MIGPMISGIQSRIAIYLILIASGGFLGYHLNEYLNTRKIQTLRDEHQNYLNEEQKQKDLLQQEINTKNEENNKLSAELEIAQKNRRIVQNVITKEIKTEVEKPVYRDCIIPLSGVQLLNKMSESLNKSRENPSPSESDGKVRPPIEISK